MKNAFFILLGIVYGQFGASQEELDLFDLVEDVNANFYDFLGVEQVSLTLLNYELGDQFRVKCLFHGR